MTDPTSFAVIAVCAIVLVVGLVGGLSWSGRSFRAPDPAVPLTPKEVARRYVWYATIAFTAGIGAGIAVLGTGGRLAMRLLAVTAGTGAQGRLTEASEVVGKITVGGTVAFVLFNGIFVGLAAGLLFLVARRFMPAGRLGGVVFGVGLLILFGTTIDPLRSDNPDFEIVGPAWLAILLFTALALAFGLTVRGFTVRMSEWLPLPSLEGRVLAKYAAPAVLAAVAFSITAAMLLVLLATVLATRWSPLVAAVRSRRWVVGGRLVAAGLLLVSAPFALASIVNIATL